MPGHGEALRQETRHVSRPLLRQSSHDRGPSSTTSAGAAGRAQFRFRLAHVALAAEGVGIGVLGGVALAWSVASLRFGAEGAPFLGLALTPLHGGLLMANGALAVLVCLGRRPTVVFSAVAAGGWAALAIVCAVQTARH